LDVRDRRVRAGEQRRFLDPFCDALGVSGCRPCECPCGEKREEPPHSAKVAVVLRLDISIVPVRWFQ
jgi:hypothetical protein